MSLPAIQNVFFILHLFTFAYYFYLSSLQPPVVTLIIISSLVFHFIIFSPYLTFCQSCHPHLEARHFLTPLKYVT
ncbi:hypothetical protein H4582DRAFT_2030230 [Lactarius indigo]|nr:hypothetical protein H4582DRAFT_2030230 [Lactarius indigo]